MATFTWPPLSAFCYRRLPKLPTREAPADRLCACRGIAQRPVVRRRGSFIDGAQQNRTRRRRRSLGATDRRGARSDHQRGTLGRIRGFHVTRPARLPRLVRQGPIRCGRDLPERGQAGRNAGQAAQQSCHGGCNLHRSLDDRAAGARGGASAEGRAQIRDNPAQYRCRRLRRTRRQGAGHPPARQHRVRRARFCLDASAGAAN